MGVIIRDDDNDKYKQASYLYAYQVCFWPCFFRRQGYIPYYPYRRPSVTSERFRCRAAAADLPLRPRLNSSFPGGRGKRPTCSDSRAEPKKKTFFFHHSPQV